MGSPITVLGNIAMTAGVSGGVPGQTVSGAHGTNVNNLMDSFLALTAAGPLKLKVYAGGAQKFFSISDAKASVTHRSVVRRIRIGRTDELHPGMPHYHCIAKRMWEVAEKGAVSAHLTGSDGKEYLLSAAHMDQGVSTIVLASGVNTYDSIGFCDFKWSPGRLGLIDIMVDPAYRGQGIGSLFQRIVYNMAGRPQTIVMENLRKEHPAYSAIADEFLNSGVISDFNPVGFRDALSRIFDIQVAGLKILNADEVKVKSDRRFLLYYPDDTNFDVEISASEDGTN